MKKVRNGVGGEVTAEIFETWFPDKPEVLLMDFLNTGQTDIFCVKNLGDGTGYVGVCHINRDYAQKLLAEFKVLRGDKNDESGA